VCPLTTILFAKRNWISYCAIGMLVWCGGCTASSRSNRVIEGYVVTTSGLANSYITPRKTPDSRERPVPGATVYLCYDNTKSDPVAGARATTDASGRYLLKIDNLRDATDSGFYYLVVEQDGYEPLVCRITIGRFSHFMENTVVMKPRAAPN